MESIECIKCGEEKPRDQFYTNKDGYVIRHCKTCRNLRTRETKRAVRLKVIRHYGGRCVCCGETEPVFLTIDHINGGGRAEYKELGPNLAYRIHMAGYPEGIYQILCWNCNSAKHLQGVCPHGNK